MSAEVAAADRALSQRCFDLTCRIERIVHLPVQVVDDHLGDLADWLDIDAPEETIAVIAEAAGLALANVVAHMDELGRYGDRGRIEALVEVIQRCGGWLVEVAQPVFDNDEHLGRFSWGHYRTATFHGATYDEALEKALAWAEPSDK